MDVGRYQFVSQAVYAAYTVRSKHVPRHMVVLQAAHLMLTATNALMILKMLGFLALPSSSLGRLRIKSEAWTAVR
jgi:hypothetical protein